MSILLSDQSEVLFYPLCLTRPVGALRAGILTIAEKWELLGKKPVGYLTREPLSAKYTELGLDSAIVVDGRIIPNFALYEAVISLENGQVLQKDGQWLAFKSDGLGDMEFYIPDQSYEVIEYHGSLSRLERLQDLFLRSHEFIAEDFKLISQNRASQPLNDSNRLIGPSANLFIEPGAQINAAIINVEEGPVYFGKDSVVMEGSLIRGPFSLGDSSQLKMGAKIYGATVIGPHCKVGGEVSNSVFHGYSNKAHDGFVGNSILGEWCNLGADTNTSNLKNNYSEVKIWSYETSSYVNSGLSFCGLFMGDHSKSGINTMFNTGTTVGVSANIFGGGFPAKFIPSFSWGGSAGLSHFELEKAFEVAERVCARRNVSFTEEDRDILTKIAEDAHTYRS